MKGVLIYPTGKCKIIKFPTHNPSSVLSQKNNIEHTGLEALAHRGSFGIFCEYDGDAENVVATKITNLLNFTSKNVSHTRVCGYAVFYKDDEDVTLDDWSYVKSMIKAKRTRVPTKPLKKHLKTMLARNVDNADAIFLALVEHVKNDIRKFWGDIIN